jgi:hypothetical protein
VKGTLKKPPSFMRQPQYEELDEPHWSGVTSTTEPTRQSPWHGQVDAIVPKVAFSTAGLQLGEKNHDDSVFCPNTVIPSHTRR